MSETSGSTPESGDADDREAIAKPIEKVKADNEKFPEKQKLENKEFPEKLKREKEGKNEVKELKNEGKELKIEKREKLENKEFKNEKDKSEKEFKNENKEFKNEKEDKLEGKDIKSEKPEKELAKDNKPEFEKPPGNEGRIGPEDVTTLPIQRENLAQHADALEAAARQLRHFIAESERPDLSRGPLQNEPDTEDGG